MEVLAECAASIFKVEKQPKEITNTIETGIRETVYAGAYLKIAQF
jgi:hypothetical protein